MKVRVLPYNEWHRLERFLFQYNEPLPKLGAAVVYVAEDDAGEIVGMWPIHSLLMGGLMVVAEEHRGNGVTDLLVRGVEGDLGEGDSLFTVIHDPHAEKLAIANGMVPLNGKLYRKDV